MGIVEALKDLLRGFTREDDSYDHDTITGPQQRRDPLLVPYLCSDTIDLHGARNGVSDHYSLGVLILKISLGMGKHAQLRDGVEAVPFWKNGYIIPDPTHAHRNWYPGFEGQCFQVLRPHLRYFDEPGTSVVDRRLRSDEADYLCERLMIRCGTRTSMRHAAQRDYYQFPAPELLDEFPEVRNCQGFGTTAMQLVNPPALEDRGIHGWYITYLCASHARSYKTFLRGQMNPEENVPPVAIAGDGMGYISTSHFVKGRRILNEDPGLFPSRIHAQDGFRNVVLGLHVNYIVSGFDNATIADLSQTWF